MLKEDKGEKKRFQKFLILHIFKLIIEKNEKSTQEIKVISMSKQANAL